MDIATCIRLIDEAESLITSDPDRSLKLTTEAWEGYIGMGISDPMVQEKLPWLFFNIHLEKGSEGLKSVVAIADRYLAHDSILQSPTLKAEMLYLKSKSLRYQHQYEQALPLVLEALDIYEAHQKQGTYIELLNGLTFNLLSLNKYEQAFVYNRKSLAESIATGNHIQQAKSMYFYGVLLGRIGNLHESIIQLIRTIRFQSEIPGQEIKALTIYADIAGGLNTLGKFKLANTFFAKSIDLYEKTGNSFGVVWAVFQYCVNLSNMKLYQEIDHLLKKHKELIEKYLEGNNKYHYANFRAILHLRKGEVEQASAYISILLVAIASEREEYYNTFFLETLADFYEQSGDLPEAIKYHKLIADANFKNNLGENKSRLQAMNIQQNIAGANREKEQAEKLAQLKQEFLANMSHEIRSPMNAVIALSSLLSEEQMPDAQKHKVNIIRRSSENLLGIINDILDNAKIEAGKFTIEQIPYALRQTLDDVMGIIAFKADEKKIKLHMQIADDVPAHITGDPTRIRQVLINLLNNAVKFTKEGSVSLLVEKAAGQKLSFTVCDTGIGIPAEQIEKITAGYTQVSSDTARHYGGTGLGLKISKELIQLMGGTLRIESTPGQGSTFSFALPYEIADGAPQADADSTYLYSGEKKLSFLIADDLEDNRYVVRELLRRSFGDCMIDEVENGALAVSAAQRDVYDLVIMDLDMPVMNGIEATVQILASHPLQKILASSANVMMTIEDLKSFGFSGFLLKPFTKEQFEGKMRELFQPLSAEA